VLTGRAVGLLVAVKQQASKFAEEAQLEELQKELLETTKQIQSIRSEIRSGWSVQSSSSLMQQLSRAEQQHVSRREPSDQPSSLADPGEVSEKPAPSSHEKNRKLVQKAPPEGGLNISAKDAGYKTHTEGMPSGADIILDALLEEKVNHDVQQALDRIQKQQPLDARNLEELGLKPSSQN